MKQETTNKREEAREEYYDYISFGKYTNVEPLLSFDDWFQEEYLAE